MRLRFAYGLAAGVALGYCISRGVLQLIDGHASGAVPLVIGLTGLLLAVAVVLGEDS
jgi:hypothetical protein